MKPPQILILDNYDSFTYNLYDYLSQLGANCTVVRNDTAPLSDLMLYKYDGIVLSPGPGRPEKAGVMMQPIKNIAIEK